MTIEDMQIVLTASGDVVENVIPVMNRHVIKHADFGTPEFDRLVIMSSVVLVCSLAKALKLDKSRLETLLKLHVDAVYSEEPSDVSVH